jgi:hypothetical protein
MNKDIMTELNILILNERISQYGTTWTEYLECNHTVIKLTSTEKEETLFTQEQDGCNRFLVPMGPEWNASSFIFMA